MNKDQTREVLSAVLDGEAAELETRRSLRDLDQDDLGTLARWQLASDVLARHPIGHVPAGFNARLANALAEERQASAGIGAHLGRLAVAASVAMATVFGWQYWDAGISENATTLAVAPTEQVRQAPAAMRPLAGASLVSQGAAGEARVVQGARTSGALSPMLVRHSELAARHGAQGLAPYVRLVSTDARQERR